MSVYDNELIINGEAVRSPEQQVYKNMKDIQTLKETIKPIYNTSVTTLTSSSVSIATSSVEGLGDKTDGWLLDPNGLLFKITANDGTTTTLKYYSNLKGPQGEDGAPLNIDDSITSLTKVWSSKKTDDEIKGLIDDNTLLPETTKTWSISKISSLLSSGVAWTTTDAVGGVMSLSNIYIGADTVEDPTLSSPKLKPKDIILYVNNDGACEKIYYVTATTSNAASVTKMCDVGGGKQLYQYNIGYRNIDSQILININFILADVLTDLSDLRSWLTTNSHTSTSNLFYLNGGHYKGNVAYALYLDNTTIKIGYCTPNSYTINYGNLDNSASITKRDL